MTREAQPSPSASHLPLAIPLPQPHAHSLPDSPSPTEALWAQPRNVLRPGPASLRLLLPIFPQRAGTSTCRKLLLVYSFP